MGDVHMIGNVMKEGKRRECDLGIYFNVIGH